MHGAVGVAAEAAHLACGEGHVGQAAKAVVPEREVGVKSNRGVGYSNHSIKQRPNLEVFSQILPREKRFVTLSDCLDFFGFMRRKSWLLAEENQAKNRK